MAQLNNTIWMYKHVSVAGLFNRPAYFVVSIYSNNIEGKVNRM